MQSNQFIICLLGPTASGKTRLALALAQKLECEIVSVDSAMVYCGMDIGTAKPDLAERERCVHHLIDICDPAEIYSAGQFQTDATLIIKQIWSRGKIPLLVGGTMLYFRALLQGLAPLPVRDVMVREEINEEARQNGWAVLHERLAAIDPIAAARINLNDAQRIQRALEVYKITGHSLSQLQAESEQTRFPYRHLLLALRPTDREQLYKEIAVRFDQMLEQGFVEEVRRLKARQDLQMDIPSMRAVGYRQVWSYLLGHSTYDEMRERGVTVTRQLAKRQLTWMRNWSGLHNLDTNDTKLLDKALSMIDNSFFCKNL